MGAKNRHDGGNNTAGNISCSASEKGKRIPKKKEGPIASTSRKGMQVTGFNAEKEQPEEFGGGKEIVVLSRREERRREGKTKLKLRAKSRLPRPFDAEKGEFL